MHAESAKTEPAGRHRHGPDLEVCSGGMVPPGFLTKS
jgi:hypothetical protein